MGIRAHRAEVKYEGPTFKLTDDKLNHFLEANGAYEKLDMDGGGFADIAVSVLKEALRKADELEIDEYTQEDIREDIKHAEKQGDDYILYGIF